jgi:hypothetical protein
MRCNRAARCVESRPGAGQASSIRHEVDAVSDERWIDVAMFGEQLPLHLG